MLFHLIACGFYWIGTISESPHWIDDHGFGAHPFAFRYAKCVLWSVGLLGVGTTDIYPTNAVEAVYSVLALVVCVSAVPLLASTLVVELMQQRYLTSKRRAQERTLRDYLRQHHISDTLWNRIWSHLRVERSNQPYRREKDVELMQLLPDRIRQEVRSEAFVPVLTFHPFFHSWAISQVHFDSVLDLFAKGAIQQRQMAEAEVLFFPHEELTDMVFVMRGQLGYRSESHHPFEEYMIRPGEWLSEVVIWLRWVTVGNSVAKASRCDLVTINPERFRIAMVDSVQARKYAHIFSRCAKRHLEANRIVTEMFGDEVPIQEILQVFDIGDTGFDITRCHPKHTRITGRTEWNPWGRNEWKSVWSTEWQQAHLSTHSCLTAAMTTDLKRDAILVYQTLFAQNLKQAPPCPKLSDDELAAHDEVILFFKRLVLLIAFCGLRFTSEENGESSNLKPWPFPLAAAFCHGSRILVRADNLLCRSVFNVLFFGKRDAWDWTTQGLPPVLHSRIIASHGVTLDREGRLREMIGKWTGVSGLGKHFGVDLPVGGLGNPGPDLVSDDYMVGPAGIPYKVECDSHGLKTYVASDLQHGHLYVYMNDHSYPTEGAVNPERVRTDTADTIESELLASPRSPATGPTVGSILLGVERSAPLKKDLLGGYHSPDCSQGALSAFGKRKWRDYWQSQHALPADIGGMHVYLNKKTLKHFERFLQNVQLSKPSDGYAAGKVQTTERTLFRSLLQSSSEEASVCISNHVTDTQLRLSRTMSEDESDEGAPFSPADASLSGSPCSSLSVQQGAPRAQAVGPVAACIVEGEGEQAVIWDDSGRVQSTIL
jgi:hypothetical protein